VSYQIVGCEVQLAEHLVKTITPSTVVVWDEQFAALNQGFYKRLAGCGLHYRVKNPEQFKSFETLTTEWSPLLELMQQLFPAPQSFMAIGGGALSDAVGLLAALWRRGRPWVGVPTTWIAVLDAAHGGKTALNFNAKNQLGVFHNPQKVWICPKLMSTLPALEAWHAVGELHKIACLSSGQPWVTEYLSKISEPSTTDVNELLADFMQQAIDYKYAVLEQDPREVLGKRVCLNFGHTAGHVIESALGWPHGYSVLRGIELALHLSRRVDPDFEFQNLINKLDCATKDLIAKHPWAARNMQISKNKFLKLLAQDKKSGWVLLHPKHGFAQTPLDTDEVLKGAGEIKWQIQSST
jgi:3-dehydroquinate synthase